MMFLEAKELDELLRKEDFYIAELKKRWGRDDITPVSEHVLRMGKRTELLGDLQIQKERENTKPA